MTELLKAMQEMMETDSSASQMDTNQAKEYANQ
jgi:hypothetical protein